MLPKVLIVEDSVAEMRLATSFLEASFEVAYCVNGEGLDLKIAEENPDLILMDVVMPNYNGFELTRKIKRGETTKHIPVIIVSGKNQPTDLAWGKRQGADDYLIKPYTREALLDTVAKVMGATSA